MDFLDGLIVAVATRCIRAGYAVATAFVYLQAVLLLSLLTLGVGGILYFAVRAAWN